MNTAQTESRQLLPAWLKTALGIVVFGCLLLVIVLGSGVLETRTTKAEVPLHELPVKERGEMAVNRKQWKVAENAYREMLKADPFDAYSMFYVGFSLHNQDKFDEAKTFYKRAAEFYRFRIYSFYNLASINAQQKNLDEALGLLEKAIDEGMTTREGIKSSEDFENLYDDPEFERLAMLEEETRAQRQRRRIRSRQ